MLCPLVGTKFCSILLQSHSSRGISFQSIPKEENAPHNQGIFAYFANGWVFIVVRKLKTRKMSDLLSYTCLLVKDWKVQIWLDINLLGGIPTILLSLPPFYSSSHTW